MVKEQIIGLIKAEDCARRRGWLRLRWLAVACRVCGQRFPGDRASKLTNIRLRKSTPEILISAMCTASTVRASGCQNKRAARDDRFRSFAGTAMRSSSAFRRRSGKTKEPDVSYILAAAEEIKQAPARRTADHSRINYLSRNNGRSSAADVCGHRTRSSTSDFLLAFSPERVDPGNPDFQTHNIPKVGWRRDA